VKLGSGGAEEIIQIKLTAEENAALQKSSASVRELVNVLGLYDKLEVKIQSADVIRRAE